MLAAKRYLAVSIDLTVSSSSIFRAVSSEGAQKIFGLETWRVMFCSLYHLHSKKMLTIYTVPFEKRNIFRKINTDCGSWCRLLKLKGMVSAMQSRAARGLLHWTQNDLAREAGVSAVTIRNYENGKTEPNPATLVVLQQTFERAGVEFIADGRGVQLNQAKSKRKPK
jgi:DNA-binding XRE family transcriptional regulator